MRRQFDAGQSQLLSKEANLFRRQALALRNNRARNGVMQFLDCGNGDLTVPTAGAAHDCDVVQDDRGKTVNFVTVFGAFQSVQLVISTAGAPLHGTTLPGKIEILSSLCLGAGGREFESRRPDHFSDL